MNTTEPTRRPADPPGRVGEIPDAAEALRTVLRGMAGPDAVPRADQVRAVDAVIRERRRVLLVQPTGWGKSAVYWAATLALRAAGSGPTVVVSPLLALMRDQVTAAERAGLRAVTINSANADAWADAFAALDADTVDVLLVSPERLANPRFADVASRRLASAGLLVIDEAHCISDWGFDFRPDYQRVARLLAEMAPDAPVLATTATANDRVTRDVAAQLGGDTLTLRGRLARESLSLAVVPGLDGVARMAWVADALDRLPGSGIVYALTVTQATTLAEFLAREGFAVAAYTGQTPPEERARIEDALRDNQVRAVVATSALGMGYDKPDLAFCIHVGSPDSPVAYYQQVGRAGRALASAVGVLLPAAESDPRIWDWFATATVPDPDLAERVLAVLASAAGPVTVPALEAETGGRRGRLEGLLKILAVDGAVARSGSGWAATGQPWHYDAPRYAALVAARRAESGLMRQYAGGHRCLMAVLTEALDDPSTEHCGRCSVCTGQLPSPGDTPAPGRAARARAFLRGRDTVLEPRRQWPQRVARRGRITGLLPGRAVCFADDPVWASIRAELAAPDAPPSPELKQALVDVLVRWRGDWGERPVAVVPVPSRHAPMRVTGMAEHVAGVGRLPLWEPLRWQGSPPPTDVASGARVAGLLSGIARICESDDPGSPDDPRYGGANGTSPADSDLGGAGGIRAGGTAEVPKRPPSWQPEGPVLLIDDALRTGWTVTVAGALLVDAGATGVMPLVGHKLA